MLSTFVRVLALRLLNTLPPFPFPFAKPKT
jgi:hypothetical protein